MGNNDPSDDADDIVGEAYDDLISPYKRGPPSVDELDALRRREAQLGWVNRRLHEIANGDVNAGGEVSGLGDSSGREFNGVVYKFLTSFVSDAQARNTSLAAGLFIDRWRDLEDKEQRRLAVVLIALAREGSVRGTVRQLEDQPDVAKRIGFDDGVPDHSTISRSVDLDDDTKELLQPFVKRMRHAALRAGASVPDSLAEDYDVEERLDADFTVGEKMNAAESILISLLVDLLPHIDFDRDPEAPNYSYSPEAFYALLAHLALERSYAETGARTLQWMDAQEDVPPAKTLFRYIREYSVEEIDTKFAAAMDAFFDRVTLPSPAHLAYDVTNVRWYGDSNEYWPSGTYPKDNTSSAWQFAVLSVAHPDHMYILGTLPLRSESKVDGKLRLFLRRAIDRFDVSVGRVYMDSQLANSDTIKAVQDVNADYLIQAPDDGSVSDLLDAAPPEESVREANIPFGGLSYGRRPDAFAYPIPPEEVGGKNQKRDHTPFLTSLDVDERDLRGLAYQFRSRWRIETSIRELKNRFHPRTRASDGKVRTWYVATAALFYNLHTYINGGLAPMLRVPEEDVHLAGEEFLHLLREGEFVGELRG